MKKIFTGICLHKGNYSDIAIAKSNHEDVNTFALETYSEGCFISDTS